jgi:predicted transcriptional regulator
MEVHLTPEQVAELSELATRQGRNANELAQEVIGSSLEHEARFVAAVKHGFESIDRGEYVTQEEVGERIDRLFRSKMKVCWSPEAAEDLERSGQCESGRWN